MLSVKAESHVPWQIDFADPKEISYWSSVNDTVMGGKSQASLKIVANLAYFAGEISLQNNGGFASVKRQRPIMIENNLPIKLRVKGDGRDYQIRLYTADTVDGVAYVAHFSSPKDQWQRLSLDADSFVAQYRGRRVNDSPAIQFAQVLQIGVMLADKQSGSFELVIKDISQ